jgi:hypothetical protein
VLFDSVDLYVFLHLDHQPHKTTTTYTKPEKTATTTTKAAKNAMLGASPAPTDFVRNTILNYETIKIKQTCVSALHEEGTDGQRRRRCGTHAIGLQNSGRKSCAAHTGVQSTLSDLLRIGGVAVQKTRECGRSDRHVHAGRVGRRKCGPVNQALDQSSAVRNINKLTEGLLGPCRQALLRRTANEPAESEPTQMQAKASRCTQPKVLACSLKQSKNEKGTNGEALKLK